MTTYRYLGFVYSEVFKKAVAAPHFSLRGTDKNEWVLAVSLSGFFKNGFYFSDLKVNFPIPPQDSPAKSFYHGRVQQSHRQVYEFFLKFTVVAKVRHFGRVPGDLYQMPAVSWSLAAPLLQVYELFLNFRKIRKLLHTGA